MHKKSIAKNHLSEAAKKGRYGDNILVHMNKDEAAVLAKASGIKKLPTNPDTGLPEAFAFTTALAVGNLAVGAYSAWKGGKEQSRQASRAAKEWRSGIAQIAELAQTFDTSIINPTEFSPLR